MSWTLPIGTDNSHRHNQPSEGMRKRCVPTLNISTYRSVREFLAETIQILVILVTVIFFTISVFLGFHRGCLSTGEGRLSTTLAQVGSGEAGGTLNSSSGVPYRRCGTAVTRRTRRSASSSSSPCVQRQNERKKV